MQQLTLGGERVAKRPKTSKKDIPFCDEHRAMCGLKVVGVNAVSRAVETVVCCFCVAFGREDSQVVKDPNAKPRPTISTKKYFTTFRPDLYKKHLVSQHPAKWKEYELGDVGVKEVFFNVSVPFVETLKAVYETESSLRFVISEPIITTIIGELLFSPTDASNANSSRDRALAVFKAVHDNYEVEEKHPSRFRLCVRFMGRGASFRMVGGLMDDTRTETGIGRLGGCTELVAARYTRIVCAASLQLLSDLLSKTWAVSFAMDCATHQGRSYVDIRCRFSSQGRLHNYHLLAIPLYERHTAVNIHAVVTRFLDVGVPVWRRQIVGVATDGAANMVGHIGGVVTLIEKESEFGVTRVWCGLHQLDLKMQSVFEQALNETYLGKLYALIGYLRRQQTLVTEMKTTWSTVANTRWLSMYQVVQWLCKNGFRVRAYLKEKQAACDPNEVWWIFLFAMRTFAKEANAVFVSLQGLSTLVEQQHDRFVGLVSTLCKFTGTEGPLDEGALSLVATRDEPHEVAGEFTISHSQALIFLQQQDLWVCEQLETLPDERKKTLLAAVARLCVVACSTIHSLTSLPRTFVPVTPQALVKTPMPAFLALINRYRGQLVNYIGDRGVYRIGDEFAQLNHLYKKDESFREAIEKERSPLAKFDEIWKAGDACSLFPHLVDFCGGLATVFPNTATVESDFSLIGCEKTDRRTSLTDLSLEGILHCKQWQDLNQLVSSS